MISKASATGMSQLSLQGWIHGVFVFTPLSLTWPPEHPDDLLNNSNKLTLTWPPEQPDDLRNNSNKVTLTRPPEQPDDLRNRSHQLFLT